MSSMRTLELREGDSAEERILDVADALDLASDQDTGTWIVDQDGKRLCAIVPVDVGEAYERWLDELLPPNAFDASPPTNAELRARYVRALFARIQGVVPLEVVPDEAQQVAGGVVQWAPFGFDTGLPPAAAPPDDSVTSPTEE